MKKQNKLIIISIILTWIGMSCILTSSFPKLTKSVPTNTPEPTATPLPVSTIAPTLVITDDTLVIIFSEADVLTWINDYQKTNSDITIQNPHVTLDNGICTITGTMLSGFISGDVELTFSVALDASSNPVVTIESMKIGGMDLPKSMQQSFGEAINQSISGSIIEDLEGRTIKSIVIDNGSITIQTQP
jgi:hypothetical protein